MYSVILSGFQECFVDRQITSNLCRTSKIVCVGRAQATPPLRGMQRRLGLPANCWSSRAWPGHDEPYLRATLQFTAAQIFTLQWDLVFANTSKNEKNLTASCDITEYIKAFACVYSWQGLEILKYDLL